MTATVKKLKTVDIKGKEYVEVNERIRYFRQSPQYQGWRLITNIKELTPERVVMIAEVYDSEDRLVATGTAYEMANSTFINKTSYIENCETSAFGRALGNLGIGIDASVATFEEVQNAIANQNKPEPKYTEKHLEAFNRYISSQDSLGLFLFSKRAGQEIYTELFNSFPHGEKSKKKELARKLEGIGANTFANLKAAIDVEDDTGIYEVLEGADDIVMTNLKRALSDEESKIVEFAMESIQGCADALDGSSGALTAI